MKKTFLLVALVFCCHAILAQDILVKKNGELEKVKVLEVTTTEVKYKKYSNLDGPIFTESKANLLSVQFANGEIEKFITSTTSSTDTNPIVVQQSDSLTSKFKESNYFDSLSKGPGGSFDVLFGTWGSGDKNGMWGLGMTIWWNFNKYIAYYAPLVKFSASLHEKVKNFNTFSVLPVGIRANSPSISCFRGYTYLAMGWGMTTTRYNTVYYSGGSYHTKEKQDDHHSFALDFGVGIQVTKYVSLGYNLSYLSGYDEGCSHWFKLAIEWTDQEYKKAKKTGK